MTIWRLALCCCLITSSVRADDLSTAINNIIDAPIYQQARWGLLVVDATTGKTLYERDAGKLFIPASTTKLYSCATVLAELGPDFRFRTPVVQRGEVKDGILKGDLILIASGDLTMGGRRNAAGKTVFADNDHTYANGGSSTAGITDTNPTYALEELAKQIAERGIKRIDGEILIDDRLFPKAKSTGSGPEVLSPIIINDNSVDVIITPAKVAGQPAKVTMRPETALIQMDAIVNTVESNQRANLQLESTGPNQFIIRGQVPAKAPNYVRNYPVDDPAAFARALFIDALRKSGINVTATVQKPRRNDLPDRSHAATMPKIAEYLSEPLADVVHVTLKVSHNLYASTFPILVGVKHENGTIPEGLERQAKLLKGLGIDPTTVTFGGGAGGSSADLVTPRTTVKLLQVMAKHGVAEPYFQALPIIGVDGTLAGIVPKESPVYGKCRAKTGTLGWSDLQNDRFMMRSKTLAGEVTTAKGKKLYFAMFLNDLPLPQGGTTSDQGKVLGKVVEAIHLHAP